MTRDLWATALACGPPSPWKRLTDALVTLWRVRRSRVQRSPGDPHRKSEPCRCFSALATKNAAILRAVLLPSGLAASAAGGVERLGRAHEDGLRRKSGHRRRLGHRAATAQTAFSSASRAVRAAERSPSYPSMTGANVSFDASATRTPSPPASRLRPWSGGRRCCARPRPAALRQAAGSLLVRMGAHMAWPQQSYLLERCSGRFGGGFAAAERGRDAVGSRVGRRRRLRLGGGPSGARRARASRDGGGGGRARAGRVRAGWPRPAARAGHGRERERALRRAVVPYVHALRARGCGRFDVSGPP